VNQVALIADRAMQKLAISFEVAGSPVCQGSKIAFVRGGRAVLVDVGNRKTKTMPANRLKDWRERIAAAASQHITELWLGPIVLECEFVMPRSPSHFNKSGLKKGAPSIPVGDLDKLIRAVGDALSKVVYNDDVQIVGFGNSTKRFARTREAIGGVRVKVRQA
tara:strand:- start:1430 stop:1918 length:489 start_codon:yes stop_codon:yes gene_type:complete